MLRAFTSFLKLTMAMTFACAQQSAPAECLIMSSNSAESACSKCFFDHMDALVSPAVSNGSVVIDDACTYTTANMQPIVVDEAENENESVKVVDYDRSPDFVYVHDVAKMRLFMEQLAMRLREAVPGNEHESLQEDVRDRSVEAPDFTYVHPIDEAKVRWFIDQLDCEPPWPYCAPSVCA